MKRTVAAALAMLAMQTIATQAEDLKKFDFPPQSPPQVCGFPDVKFPANFRVYAAGGYSGRKLTRQIDQSGHEATQFDIAVNSSTVPVVLMLGSYEPTIWNIGWTRGTEIVAVVASGYHLQAVAGLEAHVPVINSSYDNRGPCNYFYVQREDTTSLNRLARKLFLKDIDQVFVDKNPEDGRIVVGEQFGVGALVTSSRTSPESFFSKDAPLAGKPGLDEAMRRGLLRIATPEDADAWASAIRQARPQQDPRIKMPTFRGAYVVLKPFTFPAGLYGAHAVTFVIPRGVPVPTGNPGHSRVFDFNTLQRTQAVAPIATRTAEPSVAEPQAPKFRSSPGTTQQQIDEAVTQGVLRLATRADSDAWVARTAELSPYQAGRRPYTFNAYVVQERFTIPQGAGSGPANLILIVPAGVPVPDGDRRFSTIYDYNTLKCLGSNCL